MFPARKGTTNLHLMHWVCHLPPACKAEETD
jgi:hypothetical protein